MRSSNSAKPDRPENSFRLAKADAFGWRADGMAGVYQSVQKLAKLVPVPARFTGTRFHSGLVLLCLGIGRSTPLRVAECFLNRGSSPRPPPMNRDGDGDGDGAPGLDTRAQSASNPTANSEGLGQGERLKSSLLTC